MVNKERIINSFLELSSIDGITGNELSIANILISKLKELNCEVKMDDAGKSFGGNSGNVIAYLKGNENIDPLFFCSHMDTIKSTGSIKHIIKDGVISTDKTTILGGDDRAGIAVILEILQVIKDQNLDHGPIEIIFTVCEEVGMFGAKFINENNIQSKYGFIFDCQASPGNYIIEAPGAVSFVAEFIGKSAHAAVSPENGINAIYIASSAISQLKIGRWDETGMLNIGTIKGGEAINVVPDKVEVKGETRNSNNQSLDEQVNYIKSIFENTSAANGGNVKIEFNKKYNGYKFKGHEKPIILARKAIEDSGLKPIALQYPGGSDANIFNSKGIETLNLGVGFKNAHSFNELIAIEDLLKAAEIGVNIILNSCEN